MTVWTCHLYSSVTPGEIHHWTDKNINFNSSSFNRPEDNTDTIPIVTFWLNTLYFLDRKLFNIQTAAACHMFAQLFWMYWKVFCANLKGLRRCSRWETLLLFISSELLSEGGGAEARKQPGHQPHHALHVVRLCGKNTPSHTRTSELRSSFSFRSASEDAAQSHADQRRCSDILH